GLHAATAHRMSAQPAFVIADVTDCTRANQVWKFRLAHQPRHLHRSITRHFSGSVCNDRSQILWAARPVDDRRNFRQMQQEILISVVQPAPSSKTFRKDEVPTACLRQYLDKIGADLLAPNVVLLDLANGLPDARKRRPFLPERKPRGKR